jgi:regulator-associated protein of mTOR
MVPSFLFRLVTAWNALAEIGQITKSSKSFGLVAKWDQGGEKVLATGDSKVVRVWDLKTELKVGDWPTGHECLVTSIDIHRCGELSMYRYKCKSFVRYLTCFEIFQNRI